MKPKKLQFDGNCSWMICFPMAGEPGSIFFLLPANYCQASDPEGSSCLPGIFPLGINVTTTPISGGKQPGVLEIVDPCNDALNFKLQVSHLHIENAPTFVNCTRKFTLKPSPPPKLLSLACAGGSGKTHWASPLPHVTC